MNKSRTLVIGILSMIFLGGIVVQVVHHYQAEAKRQEREEVRKRQIEQLVREEADFVAQMKKKSEYFETCKRKATGGDKRRWTSDKSRQCHQSVEIQIKKDAKYRARKIQQLSGKSPISSERDYSNMHRTRDYSNMHRTRDYSNMHRARDYRDNLFYQNASPNMRPK